MPDTAGSDDGRGPDPRERDVSIYATRRHRRTTARASAGRARRPEGETPTFGGEGSASSPSEVEPDRAEPSAGSETGSEPVPPPEPEPEPGAPDEAVSEPSDARQLQERIARLDETLARISSMLPLLPGGDDREQKPTKPHALHIDSGSGAVAQSVRAADS